MKDYLGNEINIGDIVLFAGRASKGYTAAFDEMVVTEIKRVNGRDIVQMEDHSRYPYYEGRLPNNVINLTALKDMSTLMNAEFTCVDYRNVSIDNNAIVYADPPYVDTKRIHNKVFDTEAFWEYARNISQTNLIFISEQTAPDDFVPIWEKQVTRTLDRNKDNQFKATEKLFVHNNWVDYMQEALNRKE